ncbi:glutaredoxin [Allofrancisella guangzhouensis]|uniref:Glutaredoxin n=1 Tax=Allofrancisella guangzhouensis TaxID=594679 RepID=A0A0A8EA59_9GAMM|nr:glutaredoxin [Allofrancisella guangzhouensis]AJC49046.1 glutaredoxin [Allofrancisella guangzhouensis]MBK2027464.1 glutaredoxin [Allofrancisella guangzhouensis]MBK2044123.1 glutaredoxin [Allofrancisella guangzhouensis]MBK2045448.1 glutaredoxin [Allofrancisella guangzhouensis]
MKVKIYTKTGCPFCIKAKQWFDQNGISYQETILDNNQERNDFYDKMNQSGKVKTHIRTVPQIFIDNEHIGGFTDLQANESKILGNK